MDFRRVANGVAVTVATPKPTAKGRKVSKSSASSGIERHRAGSNEKLIGDRARPVWDGLLNRYDQRLEQVSRSQRCPIVDAARCRSMPTMPIDRFGTDR
jgi:hypothetical protein